MLFCHCFPFWLPYCEVSFLVDLKLFEKKPKVELIHADQINAVARHDSLYNGMQFNHPRTAHNLLGYKTESNAFTKQSTPSQWVGGPAPEWPERYTLFRQYHILNKEVQSGK